MTAPARAGGAKVRRRATRLATHALPAAVLLGLLALTWQLVAVHNTYLVPRIGAIWAQLVDNPREYVDAAGNTLQESAVGLGASFAIAFSLAVAMSYIRVIERAVMPVAVIINVTPVVSLAPGLAVALGFGMAPRYLVTGIIVFFPMLVNSLIGLRSVDPEAIQYFASLNASRLEVLLHLRIPSSLPFLFAAARICFPLSIIGAVVAEFSTAGTSNGLGSLIELASQQGTSKSLPQVYAAIFCLALLGLSFTLAVMLVERRLLSWHPARAVQGQA
ncbi:MAG TPA: ABC transporter permease [Acidimicrobiales bacterium]|nr:ABC transporter permease [Acidimicrobiales bacterium]